MGHSPPLVVLYFATVKTDFQRSAITMYMFSLACFLSPRHHWCWRKPPTSPGLGQHLGVHILGSLGLTVHSDGNGVWYWTGTSPSFFQRSHSWFVYYRKGITGGQ